MEDKSRRAAPQLKRGREKEERVKEMLTNYRICKMMLESEGEGGMRGETEMWKAHCRAVRMAIEAMRGSREKAVLTMRYIQGMRMERIAECMYVSRRTVYRIHDKAVRILSQRTMCVMEKF